MQQCSEFLLQLGNRGTVARALRARGKTVRAFVRYAQSNNARAIAEQGIKLVVGDLFDRSMQGVNRVLSVQTSSPAGMVSDEQEVTQGKQLPIVRLLQTLNAWCIPLLGRREKA